MVTIRPGTPLDAAPLAALAERTFREAFEAENTPEDMAAHVARSYSPALQGRELADPDMLTLVASDPSGEPAGALVAYAQLRTGTTPACVTGGAPIELWRFYVDRRFHGRGVAHTLMTAVIAAARVRGARTLWLGVWERNARARAFYCKFGFADVGEHTFTLGADPQTDVVMELPLARATSAQA